MTDRSPSLRAPRGTHDVLWPQSARWERLVARFATLVERAGYGLTLTPVFEDATVFRRGIGEGSDVVGKEMYEFVDRDGTTLALRPEGTASIVRAFLQHRPVLPFKAWYVTAAFRHERPQAGRYRQHHQVGIEALGPADPELDIEVIGLAQQFFEEVGIRAYRLSLNSMGDQRCRPAYVELLRTIMRARRGELCEEHRDRIEANPLRVLDCKRPQCQAATADLPHMVDHLCGDCRAHFDHVRSGLDDLGIRYVIDHRLVRGFDYYTRTTFEFASHAIEAAQNGIGGGGRYDGLVEAMGGPPTPGVGFGIGIERVLLACDAEKVFELDAAMVDVFVVDLTGGSEARRLAGELRRAGWRVERSFDDRSMKAQLRSADRSGAQLAMIVGPTERDHKVVTVRAMRDGAMGEGGRQETVPRAEVVEFVTEVLTRRG